MKKSDVADLVRSTAANLEEKAAAEARDAQQSRYSNREKDAQYSDGLAQGYRLAAIELREKFNHVLY